MTTAATVASRTQGDKSYPTNSMSLLGHAGCLSIPAPMATAKAAGTARTSISRSSRDAPNAASRQNAIASYHGRCSGHTSSQATISTTAGRMTGRRGGPAGSRHASRAASATQPTAASSSSPRGMPS